MTDRIRSSRRLIIIGAALLAVAALAQILGVIPPQKSDTFYLADPDSAAAGTMVHAVIAVLLALTLVFVAARAVDRPRVSIAILHAISALMVLQGIALVGIAPAFLVHGPSLHGAILFMFLSGAAEFAAAGLVIAAASRLQGPATLQDTNAWKWRIAPAALFGIGSLLLAFLLSGVRPPPTLPAAEYVGGLIRAVVVGGYSLLVTYLLLRGLPRASRNFWIVLAINAVLPLAALSVLIVEPNKTVGLQTLGLGIISIACSYGGLALAARATKHHETA